MKKLARTYLKGEYKKLSFKTLLAFVGTSLYMVAPVDVVPDFVPVLGSLDDLTVLGLVLRQIYSEVEKYKEWKVNYKKEQEFLK